MTIFSNQISNAVSLMIDNINLEILFNTQTMISNNIIICFSDLVIYYLKYMIKSEN